jgi:hypothetical protein
MPENPAPHKWHQLLLPTQVIAWLSGTMAALASKCLGSWVQWNKSWGNSLLGSPVQAGCPRGILKGYLSNKFRLLHRRPPLPWMGSCWFPRSSHAIFPAVPVESTWLLFNGWNLFIKPCHLVFWTWGFMLTKQALSHLRRTSSPNHAFFSLSWPNLSFQIFLTCFLLMLLAVNLAQGRHQHPCYGLNPGWLSDFLWQIN